jgi:hypothetical protein
MLRPVYSDLVENGRVVVGPMGTRHRTTRHGAFLLESPHNIMLRVVVGDGMGWDHVSVSGKKRCPNWFEMEWVRGLFFEDDDWVMQLSPPRAERVNVHEYCLHLWRPHDQDIPLPHREMV